MIDTAGRLHNKKNLMEELRKMNKIIDREFPEAYRETLVVLDATTGQNALQQAKEFNDVAEITGIVLTKMDGTAKGGIAVAIHAELGVPVKYIGGGETIDDLQKFDADDFVNALFERPKDDEASEEVFRKRIRGSEEVRDVNIRKIQAGECNRKRSNPANQAGIQRILKQPDRCRSLSETREYAVLRVLTKYVAHITRSAQ